MNDSTLLLVDDESQIRRVLRATLCEAGYVVILAKNGQEGIDTVVREHPDVVLLDTGKRSEYKFAGHERI
jgi:DNA-binding response OmpR family regulator